MTRNDDDAELALLRAEVERLEAVIDQRRYQEQRRWARVAAVGLAAVVAALLLPTRLADAPFGLTGDTSLPVGTAMGALVAGGALAFALLRPDTSPHVPPKGVLLGAGVVVLSTLADSWLAAAGGLVMALAAGVHLLLGHPSTGRQRVVRSGQGQGWERASGWRVGGG